MPPNEDESGLGSPDIAASLERTAKAAIDAANSAREYAASLFTQRDAESQAAKAIEERDAAFKRAGEEFKKFASGAGGMALGITAAAGALDIFVNKGQGLKSVKEYFTDITDKIRVIGGDLLKAVAPFFDQAVSLVQGYIGPLESIYGVMIGEAAKLLNDVSFAQAREEVRRSFGDLARAEAKSVLSAYADMRKSASSLAGTTLSMSKVFGRGPGGAAAALKYFNDLATSLGPTFSVLRGEIEKNADQILIYQKGLGLTNEQMRSIANKAIATGRPIEEGLKEISRLAVTMGGKFNISSKLIGRDLGYMTQNVGKFGSMTKTQMATAAVYTNKLGLEIKDIEGLIDKFDDFESAATGASKLAQAFGMNVDALQMMKEQDPAKRLDMLRQAFASTGKSIENMSRQEMNLLAETSGLDANFVELALSAKNAGMSYSELQKEAQKSGKEQKSQAEIMESLSKNIERVVESMGVAPSLLQEFLTGFMEGISMSLGFKDGLKGIMEGLRAMRDLGREVGRVFADNFPGVKDLFTNIGDTVRGLTTDLRAFTTGTAGATGGLANFFSNFSTAEGAKKSIDALFDGANGMISKETQSSFDGIFTSYNTFLLSLVRGVTAIIPRIAEKAVEILGTLVDGLTGAATDPANQTEIALAIGDLFAAANEAWEKIQPMLVDLFKKLGDWFKEQAKDEDSLVSTLFDNAEPIAKEAGDSIIAGLYQSLTSPETLSLMASAVGKIFLSLATGPVVLVANAIKEAVKLAFGEEKDKSSESPKIPEPTAPAAPLAGSNEAMVADQAKNQMKIRAAKKVFDDLKLVESRMAEIENLGGFSRINEFLIGVVVYLDDWYDNYFVKSNFFTGIDYVVYGFQSLSALSNSVASVSNDLSKVVEKNVESSAIENYFNNLEKNIDVLSSHTKKMTDGNIGEIAKAAATELIEMHEALANVPAINVRATIAKLGNKLSLANEVLKVEKKPIVLNVSLDLTMKAEDITKEIFKTDARLRKTDLGYTEDIKYTGT